MKSLKEYLSIYRDIAKNLNLQGDSVEMIAQMLANATYFSEVEHISYSQEASLEKATLMNSKIQHCVNNMYSVYRGSCPRVILNFKSNSYFEWNVFDEIASFNNFKLYYLGYLSRDVSDDTKNMGGTGSISDYSDFTYAPIVIPPTGETTDYTIITVLSPKLLKSEWTLSKSNTYYVNFLESDLSNDIMVKVNGEYHELTRVFSEHIKNGSIFDLTLPDFGLRLYAPDIFRESLSQEITETPVNTTISAEVFKYSLLSSYNESELKQIKVKGVKLSPHASDIVGKFGIELAPGVITLEETPRDSISTIHYKASRDRYMGSMIRSNSDVGLILEETYPDKIRKSGTSFSFEKLNPTREVIYEVETDFEITNPNVANSSGNEKTSLTYPTVNADGSTGISLVEGDNYYLKNTTSSSYYTKSLALLSPGNFKDGEIQYGVIKVPISGNGRLEVLHRSGYNVENLASYEILPSHSCINLSTDNKYNPETINISVIKTELNKKTIFTNSDITSKGLIVYYSIDGSSDKTVAVDGVIPVSTKSVSKSITVYLNDSSKSSDFFDIEEIPVVHSISELKTEEGTTSTVAFNELLLDISNDRVLLEVSSTGEIKTEFPIKISCGLYSNGSLLNPSSVEFSIISDSLIECEISEKGILSIKSVSEGLINSAYVTVLATYQGTTITKLVEIKSTATLEAFKTRHLVISNDPTGITSLAEYVSPLKGTLSVFEYNNPNVVDSEDDIDKTNREDYLYLWLKDNPRIHIYSIKWVKYQKKIESLGGQDSSKYIPKLNIYYIPYNYSTILTNNEIKTFINEKLSYYVTHDISVIKGNAVNVIVNLKLELFYNESVDLGITEVLETYSNSFNVNLEELKPEIITSISKLANVKRVSEIDIEYRTELGDDLVWEDISSELNKTYFIINHHVISKIG